MILGHCPSGGALSRRAWDVFGCCLALGEQRGITPEPCPWVLTRPLLREAQARLQVTHRWICGMHHRSKSFVKEQWASQVVLVVKNSPANAGDFRDMVKTLSHQSLGWDDPLKEGMTILCSILAWRIPLTKTPGRPLSTGSQSARYD